MKLTLHRTELCVGYTAGQLYIDGSRFCATLEDTNRDKDKNGRLDGDEKKIYGETCIPFGIYRIRVSLSPKFNRELPEVMDVPHFSGIRIHRGNTAKDTLGCILVGERVENGYLHNSTIYETQLTKLLKVAQERGEEILLTIH